MAPVASFARAVRTYLDHLGGRARAGREHAGVLPARPASDTWRSRSSRAAPGRRGARGATSPRSWRRCARGTRTIRRWARAVRPGRWSRCAGSTGSRCARGSARPTRPAPVQAAGAGQAAAEGAAARRTSRRSCTRPATPGTTLALRDQALLELLYGSGARISEAVGLDVDDLDLDRRASSGCAGKGGKERLVPVGSYAVAALGAYLVRRRPELVAAGRRPGQRGARCSSTRAAAGCRGSPRGPVLGKAAERAGITADVSPHTLAALVRDPPARRGSRRPGGPGAARPRLGDHDPGLHAGHGRPAPRGLRHRHPRAL